MTVLDEGRTAILLVGLAGIEVEVVEKKIFDVFACIFLGTALSLLLDSIMLLLINQSRV